MQKDTSEIVKELGLSPDFQTFYNENKEHMISDDLSHLLAELLEHTGLKKSQVIKDSELSEIYGYQIFSGVRVPERKKLLCLAVGMRLNIEQTQSLLKKLHICRKFAQNKYPILFYQVFREHLRERFLFRWHSDRVRNRLSSSK